ncbi:DUF192 domain-containing protein [Candidimonas sp. SYP-B2681]|uniref:DUF192 domain-containing protein n=1 Tax=Candidimonas sp. SYP-B2681 TaxID=2497686 RepID=UPI000F87E333|nr:DUF192 domain-containing protein [Candidimonas sp. SYP-B2681]RTZ41136.1 DUF192 domain-containing protein [Candidimonas sp. SYP-B2681]
MPVWIHTEAACHANDAVHRSVLTLHVASRFWDRLRGLHAYPRLPENTGLHLMSCSAIHTFGMSYAIDVIFLDHLFNEVRLVNAMPSNRMAFCLKAASVVELPAGYCRSHPGYLETVRQALHLSSAPRSRELSGRANPV